MLVQVPKGYGHLVPNFSGKAAALHNFKAINYVLFHMNSALWSCAVHNLYSCT